VASEFDASAALEAAAFADASAATLAASAAILDASAASSATLSTSLPMCSKNEAIS